MSHDTMRTKNLTDQLMHEAENIPIPSNIASMYYKALGELINAVECMEETILDCNTLIDQSRLLITRIEWSRNKLIQQRENSIKVIRQLDDMYLGSD